LKLLLFITALIEAGAGAALLLAPEMLSMVLLGTTLDGPAALVVARIAGAALLSLGIACWIARKDVGSAAARGVVAAMLFYNLATSLALAYAALGLGLTAIALWPCVLLHATLAAWCAVCLRRPQLA
jgi:hypothetical protein